MGSKHRKQGQRARKIALIGATSATATALTVGAAPPPPAHHAVSTAPVALAAATGPDYTALIESMSNSTNNILFAQGNFEGALAGLLNPLAAASGGLLPTVNAGTTQENLLEVEGILGALQLVLDGFAAPDLTSIPGLPVGAAAGLSPLFTVVDGVVTPTLGTLGGWLTLVNGVLTGLNAVPLLDGVPGLDELIPGLTATLTSYQSSYDWPLLGLGAVLGLSGQTNITNIFAQLPSLTAASLVSGILSGLNVAGLPISTVPGLTATVNALLSPLNIVNTPSITAWVPTASGQYGLPFGGSMGFLSTVPVLDVGPIAVGPVVLSDTDTVVAIPINAAGVTLPFGLASLATLSTPGVVLPTATGVNTIGGVSLTSLTLLGLVNLTNTNIQPANYYGTNGIDYSNGQNILLVTTPIGALPIIYSLGAINLGDSGFGIAGPSLFGVGLLPPFQVGTAPEQQSPDGLLPAAVLNLLHNTARTAVPTQATSVAQLLGIPDVGDALSDAVLTPGFNLLLAPIGGQITNAINQLNGPLTNGLASELEQITGALAELSYGLPGANTPVVTAPAAQNQIEPLSLKTANTSSNVVEKKAVVVEDEDTHDPIKNVQNQLRNSNTQITTNIAAANAKTKAAVAKASADIEKSAKKAGETLNKIAKDGQDQIKKTVATVQKAVKDAGDNVGNAAKAATEKKSEAKAS